MREKGGNNGRNNPESRTCSRGRDSSCSTFTRGLISTFRADLKYSVSIIELEEEEPLDFYTLPASLMLYPCGPELCFQ